MDLKIPKSTYLFVFTILLIAGTALGLYANSLSGEFLWDDIFFVKSNPIIRDLSRIPQIFQQHIGAASFAPYAYYRPIQELSYALDDQLWGLEPFGYHLTNVFLHIVVTVLVFLFIRQLGEKDLLAFLASLFFLVLPVHVEAVSYISGRGDLLCLMFLLAGFLVYLQGLNQYRWDKTLLAFIFFTLALFSKENAIILPFLVISYHIIFSKKMELRQTLSWIMALIFYLIIRFLIRDNVSLGSGAFENLFARLPGFFSAQLLYLRLLFFPVNLHFDYGQELFAWSNPFVILGMGTTFGLIAVAVILAAKRGSGNPLLSFSVTWYLLTMLPVSNFFPMYSYAAEHHLYFPSVGFAILLASFFLYLATKKPLRMVAAILGFIVWFSYASVTVSQNTYWQDPVSFYLRTLRFTQRDSLFINLGVAYEARKNWDAAILAYQKAMSSNTASIVAYRGLAKSYMNNGELGNAETALFQGLKRYPADYQSWSLLGSLFVQQQKREEAEAAFRKALAIQPKYYFAAINLGGIYREQGRNSEAIAILNQVIKSEPHAISAYYNLALVYCDQQDYQTAEKIIQTGLQYAPMNRDLLDLRQAIKQKRGN